MKTYERLSKTWLLDAILVPNRRLILPNQDYFFQFYNTLFTEDLLMIFFNFRTQHTYYFICVTIVIFRF